MKELILNNLALLKTLAERFRLYQNAQIDLKRIIYFLMQFEDVPQARVALDLLSNIDFIDSNKMTYLLKQAYNLPIHNGNFLPIEHGLMAMLDCGRSNS
ncbi:MAG TPA: hypothetical protein VHM26_11790 [Chitinophagaceae bacterium]|jgi:hypothetical protein|nr:hypothetical protein [Chitinophagaceae bacterium]